LAIKLPVEVKSETRRILARPGCKLVVVTEASQ
jgi:hypothetical protein